MSKYSVDVHWDVAKVFYDIEASSPEEAERIIAQKCRELNALPCVKMMDGLKNAGFEVCADSFEVETSGQIGDDGTYEFY